MDVIQDRHGNQVRRFLSGDEAALLADPAHRPLTHSLLLAQHGPRTLFIYNNYRKYWELPGGVIDPGESPAEAAARELTEESGQHVTELRFVGLMEVYLAKGNNIEYGALYAGTLGELTAFIGNDESGAIKLWDLHEDLGEVAGIDVSLARRFAQPALTAKTSA